MPKFNKIIITSKKVKNNSSKKKLFNVAVKNLIKLKGVKFELIIKKLKYKNLLKELNQVLCLLFYELL